MNSMYKQRLIIFAITAVLFAAILVIHTNDDSKSPEFTTVKDSTYQVEVSTAVEIIDEPTKQSTCYTEDELFCMAAAIYNEAGGDECSDTTRRLVGYVILNRVNHSAYPDTIREVLEDRGQYGMFYYTGVEFVNRGSTASEEQAIERAYIIAEEVLQNRYNVPIPSNVVFQAEFEQGDSIYTCQDGLYFCSIEEVR